MILVTTFNGMVKSELPAIYKSTNVLVRKKRNQSIVLPNYFVIQKIGSKERMRNQQSILEIVENR